MVHMGRMTTLLAACSAALLRRVAEAEDLSHFAAASAASDSVHAGASGGRSSARVVSLFVPPAASLQVPSLRRVKHVARVGPVIARAKQPSNSWPLVTSRENPRLKTIRRLQSRRQRERLGLFLLEGHRLVLDALGAGWAPEFVVVKDAAFDAPLGEQLRQALRGVVCDVVHAPADVVDELSDTETPQGVLAVLPARSAEGELPSAANPLVMVLDGVTDPGNLGTLLRSASGAGADAVLLSPGCCDAFGLKALRAGMGAQLRLPVRRFSSWSAAAAQLARWNCSVYAADAGGSVAHSDVDWGRPAALVVGSEAHGLSAPILADERVQLCRIPLGRHSVESLNAAVAGSVILFEAQRQRSLE